MDILSILVTGFVGLLTLVLLYVLYMSRQYTVFRSLGIKYLTPWPAVGSYPLMGKIGMIEFHKIMYKKFNTEKVYGFYEGGRPVMVVRDLDMLRDIMVKNFNCFVNRRVFASQEPANKAMTSLEDDHWRHVRNTVSPTFSSGKMRQMCLLVEETAKSLTANVRKTCREGKEVEIKHMIGCYTMDVIANTGFGVSIDSLNDQDSQFVIEAKNMMTFGNGLVALLFLFPFILTLLSKVGVGFFPRRSLDFFNSFLDAAMERRGEGKGGKKHDFVQLMMSELNKQSDSGTIAGAEQQERKGLTRVEVQGQAFIFILAGYDTVSTALSFAFFILAHKPDILKKVQEELDEVLAGKLPTYESIQDLVYLDMCMNEAMRMYPPGFVIDRICNQDCEVDGVKIPKGMTMTFPFIAIHNDPELFPNPEEFDPERFSAENKVDRHPYAFLPFGQGPRNCIGMRLAQMEMKIAMASVLQEMYPVPCSKSVYPPKLLKFQMQAEDGLWVKFVPRDKE